MKTRTFILFFVLIPCGWLASTAHIQRPPAAGEVSALEAAGFVPTDADLVLVVENATDLSRSAIAASFGALLAADAPLAESRAAWRALAERLGWTEAEALDHLLGGRMVLIARGIDNPETARWVLVSQVSKETDGRLKKRLQASPRKIDKGHQILSIEQGRYELTSHVRRADAHAPGREVTVLLAPTGRSELLDSMLELLAGKDAVQTEQAHIPLLRAAHVLDVARGLGTPEVLLMARLGNREAKPNDEPWPDFLVLSARRAGPDSHEWIASVVLRDRARQAALLTAEPCSSAPFDLLSRASLLTVMQMAPLATIFDRSLPFDNPLSQLPWPSVARGYFTGKQMIRVHQPTPMADVGAARPGLICTLGMETNDAPALAAAVDGPIARFFAEVERAAGQRDEQTQPVPDFSGVAPRAVRILDVELGSTGPLSGITGPGMVACWAFPSGLPHEGGWWTLAMGGRRAGGDGERSHASAALAEAAKSLRQEGHERSRWVWLMSSRPSELEAMLAPGVPDFRGVRTIMRRISSANCRLSITDRGDIQGEVRILLAEPKVP